MAQYKGKPGIVAMPAVQLVEKFADLSAMRERFDSLPDDIRQKVGDIHFTPDTISLQTPQVGAVTFRRTELSPNLVAFTAEGSPVPLKLQAELSPIDGGDKTQVSTLIDVDIPMMLRPMLSGPLQQAADRFGEMLSTLL